MRSGKRYSRATFSKRVDHDAGRHRTLQALAEPAKCSDCGAIYSDRRWTLADAARKRGGQKHWRPAVITVCPACKKKQEATPSGFLYVHGDFLLSHHREIEQLLDNEAERAAVDNPLARTPHGAGDG